jgi:hypothetical protein
MIKAIVDLIYCCGQRHVHNQRNNISMLNQTKSKTRRKKRHFKFRDGKSSFCLTSTVETQPSLETKSLSPQAVAPP